MTRTYTPAALETWEQKGWEQEPGAFEEWSDEFGPGMDYPELPSPMDAMLRAAIHPAFHSGYLAGWREAGIEMKPEMLEEA
jgi:hypothetical protein